MGVIQGERVCGNIWSPIVKIRASPYICRMMKRYAFLLLGFLCCASAFGQREPTPSEQFTITGLVKRPDTVTIADLKKYAPEHIGDIKITNHRGEYKKTYQGLKGIPVKLLLDSILVQPEKPKEMSMYYFVFRATDGYCNVYSWNELFNTDIGNHVFIITNYENRSIDAMPERILTLSAGDVNTGRRLLKSLASIEVRKVE